MENPQGRKDHGNKIFGALLLICGAVWLLNRLQPGLFPGWLISYPSVMILLGLLFTIKTRFQSPAPIVIVLIGVMWLLGKNDLIPNEFDIYLWPGILMIIGLFILLRPRNQHKCKPRGDWKLHGQETTSPDELNIDAIFCGSQKRVLSKDFQGGQISAVFGGVELNLAQADFEKEIVIDVSIVFGGLKLIIPNNWELKTQLTTIAAGIEDQRGSDGLNVIPEKTLILKGSVVFGGIDIRNF